MANACYTYYKIKGNQDEISRLYREMRETERCFGMMSRTDVIYLSGALMYRSAGEPVDGYFSEVSLINDKWLSFMLETNWKRSSEFEKMLIDTFPGIEIIYYSEGDDDDTYETNDRSGEFFPERYIFETEVEPQCEPTMYCETESEALGYVKDALGKEFKTVAEAQEWLDKFNETAEDGQHTKIITIRVN